MKSLIIIMTGLLFLGFTNQIAAQEVVKQESVSIIYSKTTSDVSVPVINKAPKMDVFIMTNNKTSSTIVKNNNNEALKESENLGIKKRYLEVSIIPNN